MENIDTPNHIPSDPMLKDKISKEQPPKFPEINDEMTNVTTHSSEESKFSEETNLQKYPTILAGHICAFFGGNGFIVGQHADHIEIRHHKNLEGLQNHELKTLLQAPETIFFNLETGVKIYTGSHEIVNEDILLHENLPKELKEKFIMAKFKDHQYSPDKWKNFCEAFVQIFEYCNYIPSKFASRSLRKDHRATEELFQLGNNFKKTSLETDSSYKEIKRRTSNLATRILYYKKISQN